MSSKQIKEQIYNLVRDNCPIDYNPVDYVLDIIKPLAVQKLNSCILECTNCKICDSNIKTIFNGTGVEPIFIIGETALSTQTQNSIPFDNSSKEGELLSILLDNYGIDKRKIAYMNSINCFTYRIDAKNKKIKRPPTQEEADNCYIYLEYAIRSFQPKMIILLGNIALNMFKNQSLYKIRGQKIEVLGIPAFATYSPSYLLDLEEVIDNDNNRIEFCEDIKKAFKWFNERYPEDNIFLNNNIDKY